LRDDSVKALQPRPSLVDAGALSFPGAATRRAPTGWRPDHAAAALGRCLAQAARRQGAAAVTRGQGGH